MQNLALVLLLALLGAVLIPYIFMAVGRALRKWDRTTTIFFAILFVVLSLLIISRW